MNRKKTNNPDITQEQVFAVADEFYKDNGKAPRQQDIQTVTGGSMSTINRMLKAWKEVNAKELKAVSEVPDYVRDSAVRMAATVWQDIESDMKQQVEAIQSHAQDKIDQAEQEAEDNVTEIKRLEELLKRRVAKDIASQDEVDNANRERNKTEVKLASVKAERDSFEKQLIDLKADYKDMQDRLMQLGLEKASLVGNPTSKANT